jgi:hypothetical protein
MKSGAERQRAYRQRRQHEAGEQRINAWVSARAIKVLNSLALRYGVTQKIMLERLILEAADGPDVMRSAARLKKSKPIPANQTIVTPSHPANIPEQTSLWDEPIIAPSKTHPRV